MRNLKMLTLALVMTSASVAAIGPALAKPADVGAAVAATANRSADNLKLDESRKPAEVLQFLGLQSGMQAIDLFGGNRYWAEIMAPAVGPKGHVTVWEPTQFSRQGFAGKVRDLPAEDAQRPSDRFAVRGDSSRCERLRFHDDQPELSRRLLGERQVWRDSGWSRTLF